MRRPTMRRTAVAVALAAGVLAVAGCGTGGFTGVYDLPLPGGAELGDHPYIVHAQFQDVLDLVPQAAVKVNDVAVGRVSGIDLPANGWTASVTMEINGSVRLPANAVAWLRQSSLLGEKYVELAPPTDGAQGHLADNATIPLDRTNRNPEVEEVFGALSMLLNGGGIDQIRTISQQLNDALTGNEPEIRDTLANLNTLVSNLDSHKQDITDALDGLDRLSATLAGRDKQIGNVLDNLTPGLHVLDQQRGELVTMLNSLDTLSGVAVTTIDASQADLVADLKALSPTLRQLAKAGQSLPQALQVLLTYPFTDTVLGDVKGDYLNVYLSVTAQLDDLNPDAPGYIGIPVPQTVIPPVTAPPPPTTTTTTPKPTTTTKATTTTKPPTTASTPLLPLPPIAGTTTIGSGNVPPSLTASPGSSTSGGGS